jgi:hypothetical protein
LILFAQFKPGALAEFSRGFSKDVSEGTADFGGPICVNIGEGKSGCGFIAFALSQRMRKIVGLFDEVSCKCFVAGVYHSKLGLWPVPIKQIYSMGCRTSIRPILKTATTGGE